MRLEAIIFDMDGVLVDSEPVHAEATRRLLSAHGVEFDPGPGEDFYGRTDREVFRALRQRYGLAAHEDDLAEQWIDLVVAMLPGRLVPMPGVPGVLDLLTANGYLLALASSSSPPIIQTTIDGLGLGQAFAATVSGRDVARGKPAPDIFIEAARRIGSAPASCLVVEDSQNGVRAAKAAGIPSVAVPCHATAGQDFSLAETILPSLVRLPEWIDARGA